MLYTVLRAANEIKHWIFEWTVSGSVFLQTSNEIRNLVLRWVLRVCISAWMNEWMNELDLWRKEIERLIRWFQLILAFSVWKFGFEDLKVEICQQILNFQSKNTGKPNSIHSGSKFESSRFGVLDSRTGAYLYT